MNLYTSLILGQDFPNLSFTPKILLNVYTLKDAPFYDKRDNTSHLYDLYRTVIA